MKTADIAVIGLAVMGENLILNMERNGFTVSCYNRTRSKTDAFLNGRARNKNIIGFHSLKELTDSLKSPRIIMCMVKAGNAVDSILEQLIPFLQPGDIVIDGGNSYYQDTIRRTRMMEKQEFLYVGAGVSGGEEGALRGPSIMPGGSQQAWEHIKPILQTIAAHAQDNTPCCTWIGPNGAGHFVKMVHNGIEYSDMQLISEAYTLMKNILGMSPSDISRVFKEWNQGTLNSYLIEITEHILTYDDPETSKPIIDLILDTAGQKGTGKWTSQAGLELGVPIPQITEAVFARSLSAIKEEREAASKILTGPTHATTINHEQFLSDLQKTVYAAKICSYAQGFQLLRAASKEYSWNLQYGDIALSWREGCIIRAQFLDNIQAAFKKQPDIANLLLADPFKEIVISAQSSWRRIIITAIEYGIPVPALSTGLMYYDAYRSQTLPANLIQAQRDYFGAHTYERIDKPRGTFFHTNWTGHGGNTTANTYNA